MRALDRLRTAHRPHEGLKGPRPSGHRPTWAPVGRLASVTMGMGPTSRPGHEHCPTPDAPTGARAAAGRTQAKAS